MAWQPRLFLLILLLQVIEESKCEENGCSFEDIEACALEIDVSRLSKASFKLGSGNGHIWKGGPQSDADGNPSGKFVFAETSRLINLDNDAWLIIKVLEQQDLENSSGKCLTFQYAMEGRSVDNLYVYLVTLKDDVEGDNFTLDDFVNTYEVLRISKDRTASGEWKTVSANFNSEHKFLIIFSATAKSNFSKYRGYIAVDNVNFTDEPCIYNCHFDANFCLWQNEENGDDFDWTLGRGSVKLNTGPSRDQFSSKNPEIMTGGFAYIDSGHPRTPGDKAILKSPSISSENVYCLSFWVHNRGSTAGESLKVFIEESNTPKEVWTMPRNFLGNVWKKCQVTLATNLTEFFTIFFEASVDQPKVSDVAIDTVSLREGSCPRIPKNSWSSSTMDCTFDDGSLCDWNLDEGSVGKEGESMVALVLGADFGCGEQRGGCVSFNFGLPVHHARHKASIMFNNIDSIASEGCLSFWVYASAPINSQKQMGALSVVLKKEEMKAEKLRLELTPPDSEWIYVQVPINDPDYSQVIIEVTKGSNVINGTARIDDIATFSSLCNVRPLDADVSVVNCAFDENMCQWATPKNGHASWRYADGQVKISIVEDHSYSADYGGYVFMESFNLERSDIIRSPAVEVEDPSSSYCFSFWFAAFYSDSLAKLEVKRQTDKEEELLWAVHQDQLPPIPETNVDVSWYYGQVEILSSDSFWIEIEGNVFSGGWAVDDIKLTFNSIPCSRKPHFATA